MGSFSNDAFRPSLLHTFPVAFRFLPIPFSQPLRRVRDVTYPGLSHLIPFSLIKERYVSVAYLLLIRGVSFGQRKVRKRYVLKNFVIGVSGALL